MKWLRILCSIGIHRYDYKYGLAGSIEYMNSSGHIYLTQKVVKYNCIGCDKKKVVKGEQIIIV